MESWRKVWRGGAAPLLSTPGLEALLRALEADDPRLVQGQTTVPVPLQCVQDWPVEGADAVAFCGWAGDGLETVGEVEEFFARMCFEIDRRLGEPAACRWFLNFWDETPRRELFALVAGEVRRALRDRALDEAALADARLDAAAGDPDASRLLENLEKMRESG